MKKQRLAASLLSAAIAAQAGSNTFGILFCHARAIDSGYSENGPGDAPKHPSRFYRILTVDEEQ